MHKRRTLLLLALLSHSAYAELSVEAHLFSDVIVRGQSLTEGGAAVGANVSYDDPAGWFGGVGGFYSNDSPLDASKTRNWNAFVGWFRELNGGRAVELSVVRSQFLDVSNWDYTELRGNYHLNPELSASLTWSPDYYGRDADSVIVSGNWRPELSASAYLWLSGGVGYLTGPWDTSVYFAEAGIGYRAGRFDVSLMLSAVDDDSASIFVTDDTSVALRLSYLVY